MAFMKLGEKIPILVKRLGISQAELSRTIGAHPSRISDWVNGRGTPSVQQALRIARALDVPLDYLADDEQDEPPKFVTNKYRKLIDEVVNDMGPEMVWRRIVGFDGPTTRYGAVDAGGDVPDAGKRGA